MDIPTFPFWKEVDHLFIAKVRNGNFIELKKKSDAIEYDFHNKNGKRFFLSPARPHKIYR